MFIVCARPIAAAAIIPNTNVFIRLRYSIGRNPSPSDGVSIFMRFLVALALSVSHLCAADAFLDRWQSIHAQQPADVRFEISTGQNEFNQGELIPLQLSFSSSAAKSYQADTRLQDRVGRMNGMEE